MEWDYILHISIFRQNSIYKFEGRAHHDGTAVWFRRVLWLSRDATASCLSLLCGWNIIINSLKLIELKFIRNDEKHLDHRLGLVSWHCKKYVDSMHFRVFTDIDSPREIFFPLKGNCASWECTHVDHQHFVVGVRLKCILLKNYFSKCLWNFLLTHETSG